MKKIFSYILYIMAFIPLIIYAYIAIANKYYVSESFKILLIVISSVFMYFAGPMISKYLEQNAEKKFNKSIELDARIIECKEFKNSFRKGLLKDHLEIFNKNLSDVDIYKFAVNPKTDNLVIDMAKISDIIPISKYNKQIDTRKYIDISDLKTLAKKLQKLYNQYETSGENIDMFFKSLRKLKRTSVIKNIGSCITILGIIAPAIMLTVRKFSKNPEYQVKKDIEWQLKSL